MKRALLVLMDGEDIAGNVCTHDDTHGEDLEGSAMRRFYSTHPTELLIMVLVVVLVMPNIPRRLCTHHSHRGFQVYARGLI